MIEAHEITDGPVLRLDPDELEASGGGRTETESIAGGDLSQPGMRNTFTEAGVDAAYGLVFPESAA